MSTVESTIPMNPSRPTPRAIEPARRSTAKIVGFLYLFTMACGIFGEAYVRRGLIVGGDAVQTARNIAASERLFRISIATDLLTYAGLVILVWGLYVILKPVNGNLALLATFLRLVEVSICAVTVLNAFVALRLLSGAAYLQTVDTQNLQALARVFLSVHGAGLQIGFVFVGLGSAVFSYLWLKSRYIPRTLAAWGIFSSLALTLGTLFFIVFPEWGRAVGLAYMLPSGIYEVGLGLWLLVKGIKVPIVEGT